MKLKALFALEDAAIKFASEDAAIKFSATSVSEDEVAINDAINEDTEVAINDDIEVAIDLDSVVANNEGLPHPLAVDVVDSDKVVGAAAGGCLSIMQFARAAACGRLSKMKTARQSAVGCQSMVRFDKRAAANGVMSSKLAEDHGPQIKDPSSVSDIDRNDFISTAKKSSAAAGGLSMRLCEQAEKVEQTVERFSGKLTEDHASQIKEEDKNQDGFISAAKVAVGGLLPFARAAAAGGSNQVPQINDPFFASDKDRDRFAAKNAGGLSMMMYAQAENVEHIVMESELTEDLIPQIKEKIELAKEMIRGDPQPQKTPVEIEEPPEDDAPLQIEEPEDEVAIEVDSEVVAIKEDTEDGLPPPLAVDVVDSDKVSQAAAGGCLPMIAVGGQSKMPLARQSAVGCESMDLFAKNASATAGGLSMRLCEQAEKVEHTVERKFSGKLTEDHVSQIKKEEDKNQDGFISAAEVAVGGLLPFARAAAAGGSNQVPQINDPFFASDKDRDRFAAKNAGGLSKRPFARAAAIGGQSKMPLARQSAVGCDLMAPFSRKDAEESEREAKEMTLEEYEKILEEYEKILEEKRKALQTLKSEGRKVDKTEFESMQELSNKKSNDDIFIKLGSDKDKKKEVADKEERAKKAVSINEFLKPAEGERYFGRGRGGCGRGSDEFNVSAPSIEDLDHYPTLRSIEAYKRHKENGMKPGGSGQGNSGTQTDERALVAVGGLLPFARAAAAGGSNQVPQINGPFFASDRDIERSAAKNAGGLSMLMYAQAENVEHIVMESELTEDLIPQIKEKTEPAKETTVEIEEPPEDDAPLHIEEPEDEVVIKEDTEDGLPPPLAVDVVDSDEVSQAAAGGCLPMIAVGGQSKMLLARQSAVGCESMALFSRVEAANGVMSSKLAEDHVPHIKEPFSVTDEDRNGFISAAKIKEEPKSVRVLLPEEEAFKLFDKNQDGFVSAAENAGGLSIIMYAQAENAEHIVMENKLTEDLVPQIKEKLEPAKEMIRGDPQEPTVANEEPPEDDAPLHIEEPEDHNPLLLHIILCATFTVSTDELHQIVDAFSHMGHVAVIATDDALRMFDEDDVDATVFTDESSRFSFDDGHSAAEIIVGWADILIVIPLSSNTLSKITVGTCDNLVTDIIKEFRRPYFLVPDMSENHWDSDANQACLALLETRGHRILMPEAGRMTHEYEDVVSWVTDHIDGGQLNAW